MSDWEDRKGVVVPLGLLAVGVWSYVLYTIVAAWPAEVVLTSAALTQTAPIVEVVEHVWRDDFRDPFVLAVHSGASLPREARPLPDSPEPPPFRLIGVVDGTAMLETSSATVELVRRGGYVGEAYVIGVTADSIELRFKGRAYTLLMDSER